jgi:anaerobic magnesium-protoporphyrin IX monomethyl ester cyclase
MGEYRPPPFGLLTLASYLESHVPNLDIDVIDCQAEELDWNGLTHRLSALMPDIVAPSGVATCNAPAAIKTAAIAKQCNSQVVTVVGGQHFTALAEESLRRYPEIDVIIRGEGEQTLVELVTSLQQQRSLTPILGLSFCHKDRVVHTPDRPLLENLDTLPIPGYHHIAQHMNKYYFALMAEKNQPFAIVEGSRGCTNTCSYCSQWKFWRHCRRRKSVNRLASEIYTIHRDYGSRFFWLTDDNLGFDQMKGFCEALLSYNLSDVTWFLQARSDDILQYAPILPTMQQC